MSAHEVTNPEQLIYQLSFHECKDLNLVIILTINFRKIQDFIF
jgi:hypothetical protein